MKKLLLTGSAGFTGKYFALAAEAAGYRVEPLVSDLTNAAAVFAEVARIQPQYVVHLGALSSVTHSDDEAFYKVNLFGTLNLINALCALPTKPRKVLLASSANIYGNADNVQISEVQSPRPVNHYAMSKLAMEHMAGTYAINLPIIIMRPFNYTGVGQDTRFVVPKIVEHIKSRASVIELGNLDVYREYNDVRGVCNIYLRLLEAGIAGETYNICSGKTYSLREVVALCEKISGLKIKIQVNPKFVRNNEVFALAGNSEKLNSAVGNLYAYSLEDTLIWMLGA